VKKLVTFAFAIAVLGVPATTRADDTDQVAKQSFERGRQLAGEAKWTQAFDAFSAGYDASHRSVFLFNMAECARALDDAPRARGLYQQYLTASPSGDLADTARARMAAMPAPPPVTTPAPTTVTRPTTMTTPPPPTPAPPPPTTVATRPVVIPPPMNLPHATTLSTGPVPTSAPATTAIRATPSPGPTTTATAAPTLTVAQLPPTSPAERPIGTSLLVDSHPSEPIWRRTSFWVGVGVAVAAGTVAIIAASSHDNSCSTPGCIDLRR